MKIEINEQELSLLYNRAKKGYEACIYNKDNEFLKDEVNEPPGSILVVEKNVKIVLSHNRPNELLLEANLMLFIKDREIGKYVYIEDENGQYIDEFLIFY